MSKICQVTGKIPQSGNNVSHAKNRTKRKFFPNLHTHKFWVESENRFVNLKVSAKGMRIIDKKGISEVLKELRAKGQNLFIPEACLIKNALINFDLFNEEIPKFLISLRYKFSEPNKSTKKSIDFNIKKFILFLLISYLFKTDFSLKAIPFL